jgi:alkylation response protein AidB-like acyl-CoA dehydrogenase
LAVPKEYGGPGADFVSQALVMAELARGDSAISKAFSQNWKWSHLISSVCTPEQKTRFLGAFMADDTFVLGKGITEPNAGSDNRLPPEEDPRSGVRLKAERHGDEWVLNGEKCFIANANVGKLFFIDARSNPNVSIKEGVTMFLVPRDTPGFRSGKVFNKNGWRFYQNAEMIFDNARVPHANVIGETGGHSNQDKGERTGGDLFGDLELAANALGVCMAACESAMTLAKSRTQGGKLLVEQQTVQLKIGRMNMLTEALRAYVMRVAWEHDQKLPSTNAGFVMNYSTEVIQEVTQLNMDIHGGAGFTMDAQANKLVRDGIIWTHLAGDTVQRMKVVRRLTKSK